MIPQTLWPIGTRVALARALRFQAQDEPDSHDLGIESLGEVTTWKSRLLFCFLGS